MRGARPQSTAHLRRSLAPVESFALDDVDGLIVSTYRPADTAELARVLDPSSAVRTLHWGRHYLYVAELRTAQGPVPVVVKQFRNDGWQARWRRLRHGSGARQSWETAFKFLAAGIATPEPILMAEPRDPERPSFFLTRYLPAVQEVRFLLRAINAGESDRRGGWPTPVLLEAIAAAIRRMHDAGFWHRDVSVGNVLIQPGASGHDRPDVLFVDLNRARVRRPGLIRRSRDLCRLWIARSSDRLDFVNAYWRGDERALWLKIGVYSLIYHAFRAREAVKPRVRRAVLRWRDWIVTPRPSPHVPATPAAASRRDKSVWDALSDQPVQKAGRWEKLAVRLVDSPEHARQYTTVIAAAPRVRRRYLELKAALGRAPVPMGHAGISVSPVPGANDRVLDALTALGATRVLLRLSSWNASQDPARELASELFARGYDLTFVIAQNRALVNDHARWTDVVEQIAATFTPLGRYFQIGQAINRSKWGVWTLPEYWRLFASAAAALRRHRPDVELLGPPIIDFEYERLTAAVNLSRSGVHFDIVSSLLYVDRRGAPEHRQLGFDTTDKVVLLRAIADTARAASPRAWITETNWALWEGPYSPAGRRTSVDEPTQADYLARYFVVALATGLVERAYWWQLVARGYGLMDTTDHGVLRRRPSFDALAAFIAQLDGAMSLGQLTSPPDTRLYRFHRRDDDIIVGWSTRGVARGVLLPARVLSVVDRDGVPGPIPHGRTVDLTESLQYFVVDSM